MFGLPSKRIPPPMVGYAYNNVIGYDHMYNSNALTPKRYNFIWLMPGLQIFEKY